jgi:hypothetical protein
MTTLTRSQFDAKLKELGYKRLKTLPYKDCDHATEEKWAVYTMPTRDATGRSKPPKTYGELGWSRYQGCETCCMELGGVLFCGGLYEHALIFAGEQDVTTVRTNLRVSSSFQAASDKLPASRSNRNIEGG